jgi:hypothetical protein
MARANGPEGPHAASSCSNAFASLRSRVEPLREPPIHRSQQFERSLHLALVTPESSEAGDIIFRAKNACNGSFSTDQRCFRDVRFPSDRDQIAALRQVT